MFPGNKNIVIDNLQCKLFTDCAIEVSVLRLDKLHPVVSGNKLFKLHYFIEEAITDRCPEVITFGGAFSNHLLATAFACHEIHIKSIGLVRGEKPAVLSHTLQHCTEYGMELQFLSRDAYIKRNDVSFSHQLIDKYPGAMIIPEGGYHPMGARGAALIGNYLQGKNFSHIACAMGTATTIAGLLSAANSNQQVIGIQVLKGITDTAGRLKYLIDDNYLAENLLLTDDYCFNGYAKKDSALIAFMNILFETQQIPTDFVYTAKMMYGIYDMALQGKFEAGSHIVCIHTGGLQGNGSLLGELVF